TIGVEDTLKLYAASYDAKDNFIRDTVVNWSGSSVISGALSPASGKVTRLAPVSQGNGKVYAQEPNTGLRDSTGPVTITAQVTYVRIRTGANGTGAELLDTAISTDDSLNLYAAGYSSIGTFVADQTVTWNLISLQGELSSAFSHTIVFRPKRPGNGQLWVAHSTATGDTTGTVTVSVGAISRVVISPKAAQTLTTDDSLSYSAVAFDADSNPVPTGFAYSVTDTMGAVSAGGLFTARRPGTVRIIAVASGVRDTSGVVTVSNGALRRLAVSPSSGDMTADQTLQFTLKGYDADSNELALGSWQWSLTKPAGAIGSVSGLYTPASVCTLKVIGRSGSLFDTTGDVIVRPGALARLALRDAPDGLGSEVGAYVFGTEDTTWFYAAGYDGKGNLRGNEHVTWGATGGLAGKLLAGADTSAALTSTDTGSGYLTAQSGAVTDSTGKIEIIQSGLVRINLSPVTGVYSSDTVIAFSAQGYDIADNPAPMGTLAWSVTGGIGRIDNNGVFIATQAGTGRVLARSSLRGISDTTDTITVVPGRLHRLAMIPSSITMKVDSSVNMTLAGFDADSNSVVLPAEPVYLASNFIGSVDTFDVFHPAKVDSGGILAQVSGVASNMVPVLVRPGHVRQISLRTGVNNSGAVLTRKTVVAANDTLRLTAAAYDTFGNYIADTSVNWTFTGILSGRQNADTGTTVRLFPDSLGYGDIIYNFNAGPITGNFDSIEVVNLDLHYLVLRPVVDTLSSDTALLFTAEGRNISNQPTHAGTITWLMTGPDSVGSINPATGLFTARKTGRFQLKATSSLKGLSITSDTMVVAPGRLTRLSVSPSNANLTADDTLCFSAAGYDADSNRLLSGSYSVAWSVMDSMGTISATGLFDARRPGITRIALISGSVTDTTGNVTVTHGSMVKALLSPHTAALAADSSLKLDYHGLDRDSNAIVITDRVFLTTPTLAYVNDADTLVPDKAGSGTVVLVASGLKDTLYLTVTYGIPASVTLQSFSKWTLSVYDSLTVAAVTRDAKGNVIPPDTSVHFIVEPAIASVDSLGMLRPTMAGPCSVIVTRLAFSDTSAALTITAGSLESIVLLPDSASITADSSLALTAYGLDHFGAHIDLVGRAYLMNSRLGEVRSGDTLFPDQSGAGNVILVYGTFRDSLKLTVTPGTPDTVLLDSIPMASIDLGDSLAVQARLQDAKGNAVMPSSVFTWTVTPTIGHVDSAGFFRPDSEGACRIIAQYGALVSDSSGLLTITDPRKPVALTVSLRGSRNIETGETLAVAAQLFDPQGRDVTPLPALTWHVLDGPDSLVTTDGHFLGLLPGSYRVTASFGALIDTTDSIIVSPSGLPDTGGTLDLAPYLSFTFKANNGGAHILLREDSLANYNTPSGLRVVTPVLDFSGSSRINFDSTLILTFQADTVDQAGNPVTDRTRVRLLRFNPLDSSWSVVADALPDSNGIIRYETSALFTALLAIDTLLPVAEDSLRTLSVRQNTGILIAGRVTDNLQGATAMLYYRQGGATGFDSMALLPDDNGAFQVQLDNALANASGFEYYIQAQDGSSTLQTVRRNIPVRFRDAVMAHTLPSNNYHLMSMPLDADDKSVSRLLGGLGNYRKQWRFYAWQDSVYNEYGTPGFTSLEPGRAYWLYTTQKSARLAVDSGATQPVNACFTVTLPPGTWTAVSNPFNFNVAWSAVKDSTPSTDLVGPYAYPDSGWTVLPSTGSLEPWQGYYVYNSGSAPLTLKIPPYSTSLSAKALQQEAGLSFEWSVETDNTCDAHNGFGVGRTGSTPGFDAGIDFPKPPAGPDKAVMTWFARPGYPAGLGRLFHDYSTFHEGGETWHPVVAGIREGVSYTCRINGLSALPESLEVFAADRDRGVRVNLKTDSAYVFTGQRNERMREFEIIVGNRAYVEQRTGGLRELPGGFALSRNYPNPFNPATTLDYAVPRGAKGNTAVDISIYDIRGVKVAVLVHEQRESGYYRVVWNGRDNHEKALSSGLYFCRLTGGGFCLTRKMLMVK
ncbi:MAG: hypothetical protein V1913_18780, partial [Fibrobacterota bacterium]